ALQAGPGGVDDGYAVAAAGEASRVADAAPGDAVDAAAGADDPSPAVRAAWVAAVGRLRTRAAVADVLVRITDGDPAGVPQRLCEQLMSGWGLRGAMAVAFTGTRALSVVGADGVLGDPAVHDRFAARDTVARLHDQLARGAALVHRDALPPLPPGLVTGIAPISTPTRLVGALLVAAPEGDDREVARATTLALVSELAETGGAVLSGPLEHIRGDAARRARIQRLLVPTAFTPHFQPIMELGSNRTIGFEALTRWHDRSGPADVLAEAHALGLGADTEFSLAAVATEHARGLPPDAYLALNFSASTILARPDIELLLPKDRTVVIEITENERVDDHEALRRALARLGPNVHVAVDDAGASYASLRHIVIVRPRCVKLDIYWITDLEGDPARQAVLAGLVHLSNKLGCYLVAEGIERQSELLALRQLGITHGQGTLLGRPRPASAYAPQAVLS
ncbi:MAG TPA: EAL domain-containing protein, partial [Acidimicrobiales bacterium]|nr:EAL domain-containing protein [Acidimicrobiales bacterium]